MSARNLTKMPFRVSGLLWFQQISYILFIASSKLDETFRTQENFITEKKRKAGWMDQDQVIWSRDQSNALKCVFAHRSKWNASIFIRWTDGTCLSLCVSLRKKVAGNHLFCPKLISSVHVHYAQVRIHFLCTTSAAMQVQVNTSSTDVNVHLYITAFMVHALRQ